MSDFLQIVKDRVVVYDGAMGTNIQFRNPSVDDFWGKEGCNEILVLSRPDIIKEIHADFFRVGCDVVETDTFGATSVVLAEYDLQDKVVSLQARFSALGDTWADQEHAKFAEEFQQTMKTLKHFMAASDQHVPYLLRKVQRIEEYLKQR